MQSKEYFEMCWMKNAKQSIKDYKEHYFSPDCMLVQKIQLLNNSEEVPFKLLSI